MTQNEFQQILVDLMKVGNIGRRVTMKETMSKKEMLEMLCMLSGLES